MAKFILLTTLGLGWLFAPSIFVGASECTDACDAGITPTDVAISLCGTDGLSHYTSWEAAVDNQCYFDCNVGATFQGSCSCPNDCFAENGQGTCVNTKCECLGDNIWVGPDCGSLGSMNTCSGHGKLALGEDYNSCVCDDGYTGFDCSSEVFKLGSVPFGNIFDTPAYSSQDEYQDSHPIWNISLVASIRIEMDPNEYLSMISPATIYSNETYRSATFHFDNGYVTESYTNVGIRAKGAWSRMDLKKGWAVKFNEFVKGQKLFDSIKKMGLKANTAGSDAMLRQMLYSDFSRAMSVPVQRSSFATVFINDIFEGIYIMQEDINEEFITNRIEGDSGNGNMMKLCRRVYLQYLGDNQTTYEELYVAYPNGDPQYSYEQSFGDGNWSDFIGLLKFVNTSTDEEFQTSLSKWIDVDTFVKSLAAENFMLSSDNYEFGQNYQMYHLTPDAAGVRSGSYESGWLLVQYDFDQNFEFISLGVPEESTPGIFEFFVKPVNDSLYNPLSARLLSIPAVSEHYVEVYSQFMSGTFGPAAVGQSPVCRFGVMLDFVQPWVGRDKFWQISCGETDEDFRRDAEFTMENLPLRYKAVLEQLNAAALRL
jgi:hypothetical protein